MRFLHTADLHLGAVPDRDLPWERERSQAIWDTFRRLIDAAGKQQVDLLLIAGDFFHRQPLRKECREVNSLFESIPDTRIVIIAGEHDYIRDTSPYLNFSWSSNVTFLTSFEMSSVYLEDLNVEIHGFSYFQSEITEPLYDGLLCPDDGRYHILLAHGGDETHIPIQMKQLADSCFDYVALGHLHQPRLSDNYPIAYSGSPEPVNDGDLGPHGYILGTLDEGGCQYNWYPIATTSYQTLSLTVDEHTTTEKIVETLKQDLEADKKTIYHLYLEGRRNPGISFRQDRIRAAGRIITVTDETVPAYDLNGLANEHMNDIVSHYIDRLARKDSTALEEKALFYGLRALLGSTDTKE